MWDFLTNLDFGTIFKIIGIDITLGGDNAVVIALAASALAVEYQNKAIAIGTLGAVLARAILLVFAGILVGIPFVKMIAGAYLLYIGYSLLVNAEEEEAGIATKTTLWGAVFTIVLADMGMSTDNVLAVISAAEAGLPDKDLANMVTFSVFGKEITTHLYAIYYSVLGILFSIPIIVFGAKVIMAAMEKFPAIVWLGAMLLGWVGAEMILQEGIIKENFPVLEHYATVIKALGFGAVGLFAWLKTEAEVRAVTKGN